MRSIPATLRRWHRFLKSNGLIGFNGFAETAFIATAVLVKVAKRYGIALSSPNKPTSTAQKCYALLQEAGFEDIEVKTEQFGSYITMSQAQGQWESMLKNPLVLQQLSSAQLEQLKADCFTELEALVTDKGLWNDITTFSVFGRKRVG